MVTSTEIDNIILYSINLLSIIYLSRGNKAQIFMIKYIILSLGYVAKANYQLLQLTTGHRDRLSSLYIIIVIICMLCLVPTLLATL